MNRLALLERGEKLKPVAGKCRVCLEPLPKKRRGFCSDEHRRDYLIATSPQFLRVLVWERDGGICQDCGIDVAELERRVWGYPLMLKGPKRKSERDALLLPLEQRKANCAMLMENGFPPLKANAPVSLFAVDHIIPLWEGGGFELENTQLLDVACHAEKTKDEATWRAKRRKLVGKKQSATMRRFKKMGIL